MLEINDPFFNNTTVLITTVLVGDGYSQSI